MNQEEIKQRTIELYDSLPLDKDKRIARTDVRDEVFELNHKFFGYVATHTYISNTCISYEDKYQSACRAFIEIWWKYRWGDRYRRDLAFSVFFKPRIGEMIERELSEIKYSLQRSLTMKVGDQLGIHWSKVKYDDINKVELSADDRSSLQAMFGVPYKADLETHSVFIESDDYKSEISIDNDLLTIGNKYNDIEQLLINEMIEKESKLTEKDLRQMSELYDIGLYDLINKKEQAENMLLAKLKSNITLREQFE